MPLTKWILEEQRTSFKKLDAIEVRALTKERDEYRAKYHQHWNATAMGENSLGNPTGTVDVILCPAGPGAAPPLNCARYWGYTSQWNLLDYSALVFPVRYCIASESNKRQIDIVDSRFPKLIPHETRPTHRTNLATMPMHTIMLFVGVKISKSSLYLLNTTRYA